MQVLDAVAQRRAQALAPEHLDNVWAKGRNYKKRESEKGATKNLVSNPVSPDNTVQVDASSSEEVSTSGELSKDSTSPTIPMKPDESNLDIPINKDKSAIEQYAHLFGDSKDGEEHLPGIGFSPLGTPRPSSQALESSSNVYQARIGPELVRSDNEDLFGSSANSQSTTETSGQSPGSFRYHHKSGSSSQRLRRAVRLLAHRKTKSSGGTMDGWNGLEVGSSQGLNSFLHPGEGSPVKSPASESRWRSLRKSHLPDVSLPPVQADVTELVTPTQSTKLHCQVRLK